MAIEIWCTVPAGLEDIAAGEACEKIPGTTVSVTQRGVLLLQLPEFDLEQIAIKLCSLRCAQHIFAVVLRERRCDEQASRMGSVMRQKGAAIVMRYLDLWRHCSRLLDPTREIPSHDMDLAFRVVGGKGHEIKQAVAIALAESTPLTATCVAPDSHFQLTVRPCEDEVWLGFGLSRQPTLTLPLTLTETTETS